MAPSATAAARILSKSEKSSANGKSNGTVPADGHSASAAASADERAAIETKYRDFFWTYTEEPHRTRRLEIIKAHPEVRISFPWHGRMVQLANIRRSRSPSFAVRNL
jgi:sphingolipid 4-desaturase/C4-monooxygenase